MTVERIYSAHRVDTGLYVQPANDGVRRFVIASYTDGRINGLERGPWCATYWSWGEVTAEMALKIERMIELGDLDDLLSELREISHQNTGFEKKRDAVEDALSR